MCTPLSTTIARLCGTKPFVDQHISRTDALYVCIAHLHVFFPGSVLLCSGCACLNVGVKVSAHPVKIVSLPEASVNQQPLVTLRDEASYGWYGGMEVWGYGGMGVWGLMEVWDLWRYGVMLVISYTVCIMDKHHCTVVMSYIHHRIHA